MGDQTGENSGIVIPPYQGAQLAVDAVQRHQPADEDRRWSSYDTQAKSDQAVALATKAAQQDKVVGMIGPRVLRRVEGRRRDPGAGRDPEHHPVGDRTPALSTNGWKYWHRVVATDDVAGHRHRGLHHQAHQAPRRPSSSATTRSTASASPTSRSQASRPQAWPSERDKIDPRRLGLLAPPSTKVKAANPDVIFYGGYYSAGAASCSSSCATPASPPRSSPATARSTRA